MNDTIPAAAAVEPAFKRRWRNYLLDARFQLKFTALVVCASSAVALILGGMLWRTSTVMLTEAELAVEARSQAAETSRELGDAALNNELFARFDDPSFKAQLKEQSRLLDATYDRERQAIIAQHAQLVRQQRVMLSVIVGGLLALVALIAASSIIATHKIVGPIYRVKRMMQDAREGRPLGSSKLRRGDEFQDLLDEFVKTADVLRGQRGELRQKLAGAIAEAERSGSPTLVAELRAVEAQLEP